MSFRNSAYSYIVQKYGNIWFAVGADPNFKDLTSSTSVTDIVQQAINALTVGVIYIKSNAGTPGTLTHKGAVTVLLETSGRIQVLNGIVDATFTSASPYPFTRQANSYLIYLDGSTYYARNGKTGVNDYSGIAGTALTAAVQNAINSLNSLGGGEIRFKGHTSYDFGAGQTKPVGFPTPSGLPGGVGMILYPNITISGEGKSTILTTTTAVSGSNDYFSMFVNNDHATNDGFIVIRDLSVVLPVPTETGVGMQAWDDTIVTYGMHDALIYNVYTKNGGFILYPNSVYLNTANALTLGQNWNNTIAFCMSENQTINTGFFQGRDSWFVYNRIFKTWDDAFIIASAGTGHKIIGNVIDGGVVTTNKGAATALIYLQNDGAVGTGPSSGVLANNLIANNTCKNHLKNNGGQHGIAEIGGRLNRYIENDCFSNAGNGIFLEQSDHSRILGGNYYLNIKQGVRVLQDLAGTLYDTVINGVRSFNNGTVGAQQSGINIGVNVGSVLQDVLIANCTTYDDQGGITQLHGIALNLDANLNNLSLLGNNLRRQTNPLNIAGAGVVTGNAVNNAGYNHQGWAITSPSVPSTGVDQQNTNLYPVQVYITGLGSGITAVGITDALGTLQSFTRTGEIGDFYRVEPAGKIRLTYTGSPTWKWYGQ